MIWLGRRILVSIVLAWIVASAVFFALHLVPGDPAELLLSSETGMMPDPAVVDELRRQLGLDRPLLVQYGDFLTHLLKGDPGSSMIDGYPVASEIATRLPRTLELILAATLLSLAVGIPIGARAALNAGGWFDRIFGAISPTIQSTPVFVIGTLFIFIFAQTLRLTPAGGFVPFAQDPMRHLGLLAMPAVAIALSFSIMVARMTRASMLDALAQDFVRTARAKGLSSRTIVRRHILRAALSPVVTIVGMEMGVLLGGTVLTEFIFNWPGISTPLLQGISHRDYPLVSGIVLTIAWLFILINLATDIVRGVLDPRVRAP